jgi:general secretion pathway protein N
MKLSFRFSWRYFAIALALYAMFIIATLPAWIAADKLRQQGINVGRVSGTIWNGSSSMFQVSGMSFDQLQWQIKPWSLLIGRLSINIHAKRDDGYADAVVSFRLGSKIVISDLHASLPLAAFGNNSFANGWQGTVQTQVSQLAIEKGWPSAIVGTIEAHDLNGPARQPAAIGSYKVTFDEQKGNTAIDGLVGHVVSLSGAPLDVDGSLRLMPNRQYSIDAQVATRANAPDSINQALQYLGSPDAQGKRSLSLAGSL